MDVIPGKAGSRGARSRKLTERASNAPQGMNARKIETRTPEVMPHGRWMTCTAVSRLIGSGDDRKTRARLDRLASATASSRRKREQGTHGLVYLFRSIL